MGYGTPPFGFGGYQTESPEEEERKRRELEAQEASQLRIAMEAEPSWVQPDVGVSGKLEARIPDVEEPKLTGSLDDEQATKIAAAEGDEDYIKKFEEHLADRPGWEDVDEETGEKKYQPSTLRKVLSVIGGTLAGGNPAVTRKLAGYGKYDQAMSDWEAEQSGLGDVAELREAQAREKGLASGRELSARTALRGQDITSRGQDVTERGQDVTQRGQDITEGRASRTHELDRQELNERIRAAKESERLTGERTEAYTANTEDLRAARHELSPSQQAALEKLALDDVIQMNPDWVKFARLHESGDVLGRAAKVPGEGWFSGPEQSIADPDYQEFMAALEVARKRRGAAAGLSGLSEVEPLPKK
jgi:hypothetical protein